MDVCTVGTGESQSPAASASPRCGHGRNVGRSRSAVVGSSGGASSSRASRGLAFARLGAAGVRTDTSITNGITAYRAEDRVFVTTSGPTAISAGQGYGAAFDGILTRSVALGDNIDFTAELLGWHSPDATACREPRQTLASATLGW